MTHLMSFAINMQQIKLHWPRFVKIEHAIMAYWQQWANNWLNFSSAQLIGTPTRRVHQEAIEVVNRMTQALMLIGGMNQDLQVIKGQATMILLQELRVKGHNMIQIQGLRKKARVIVTLFQGFRHKDPSIMILRQELCEMQVNMTPLIEPQDKKM